MTTNPQALRPAPAPHVRHNGSRWASLASVGLAALLVGCAFAPGMNLDAKEVRDRADVYAVGPDLLQRLAEERSKRAGETTLPAELRGSNGAYEYRVAPQDVLRVTVWNQPELTNPSGTTTELSGRIVNADGKFFFPFVGSVLAGGKTVGEIRSTIASGLSQVIKNPQVDVSVLQYRGQRVYVSGEVKAPGSVAVNDVPPDLAEIVARAGGPSLEADLSAVNVTRANKSFRLDLQAMYYNGDTRQNVRLKHGDIVNVPERRAARVFVTGEVIRPTALPLPRGDMMLSDALADAGGVNPLSASAGQVFVIRAGAQDRPQIYHLNASAPDALLLADRFVMQSRDVVYVDAAPVVRWARLMNNILPTATLVRDTWQYNRTNTR
jgi:polysaccharide biosynthesis/export protein